MWLEEEVNANEELSVSKKIFLKYRISMIKLNCHFSELQVQKVMVPMVTRAPFCFKVQ